MSRRAERGSDRVRVAAASRPGASALEDRDGWVVCRPAGDEGPVVAAVIDGAGVRLPVPGVEELPLAPLIRATLPMVASEGIDEPRDLLLALNDRVRATLAADPVLGGVLAVLGRPPMPLVDGLALLPAAAAAAVRTAFRDPFGVEEELDTRALRLVLPACVVTIVVVEPEIARYRFAHVGDSSLHLVTDRDLVCLTDDQMDAYDRMAIELARARGAETGRSTLAAALDPEVRRVDLLNGLRHNWVDRDGAPRYGQGCGVIDGLPEMAAYVQEGEGTFDDRVQLRLMTDGMSMPLVPPAATLDAGQRRNLSEWRSAVVDGDGERALQALDRLLLGDPEGMVWPRLKPRDDATLVALTLAGGRE